jgi:hypothetical protein
MISNIYADENDIIRLTQLALDFATTAVHFDNTQQ